MRLCSPYEARTSALDPLPLIPGGIPPQRAHSAPRLLPDQRGIPLPRPCLRGFAVCARRATRRGVVADRERCRGVRGVAPAVALLPRAEPRRPAERADVGRRARADEHLLLSGHRPGSA